MRRAEAGDRCSALGYPLDRPGISVGSRGGAARRDRELPQRLQGAGRPAARLRSAGVFGAWAQLAADLVEAPRFYIPGQEARPSSEAGEVIFPQT